MKINLEGIPFTQVSNFALQDKELGWAAKGVYAYILSKPKGWDFSTERMKNDSSDGIDLLKSAIRELEAKGYLVRTKKPDGKMEYTLYNTKKPLAEIPSKGKTLKGKFPRISNKESNSNKELEDVAPIGTTPVKGKKPEDEPLPAISEVIKLLESDPKRHVNIIALYLEFRKKNLAPNLKTKAQLSNFISRHSKAAVKLKVYDDVQLVDAFEKTNKDCRDIDWSLETVLKTITK